MATVGNTLLDFRFRRLSLGLLVAGLLVGQPACSGEGEDTCQRSSEGPGVDGGLQCGRPFNLNEVDSQGRTVGPGRFGIKIVEYVHVNAAGIVETDTISVLLMLADVDYHPETKDADIAVQLCKLAIPEVAVPGQPEPTVFRILPSMLPNVPTVHVKGTLSGNETCDTFSTEKAVSVMGACLENPVDDPLPTDPATQTCPGAFDPSQKDSYCETRSGCMYDLDLDGYPAATLEAENVPGLDVDLVFAVMRSWVSMEGMVATSDLLLGTAKFDLLVAPFGCRLHPLGGGEQRDCNADELKVVAKINPDITQTPGMDSTFMAVKLPPETTCQDIIDNELEIFGR